MSHIRPLIGQRGAFTFRDPFSKHNDLILEVSGLRRISSFLPEGLDIDAILYTPAKVALSDKEADHLADVAIVIFQTSDNQIIYVPESFIVTIPRADGVVYNERALVINLGSIPVEIGLDAVAELCKQSVRRLIGVVPDVKEVAIGWETLVDYKTDTVERGKYAATKLTYPIPEVEVYRYKTLYENVASKIKVLEDYILGGIRNFENGELCKDMEAAFNGLTYVGFDSCPFCPEQHSSMARLKFGEKKPVYGRCLVRKRFLVKRNRK